jgi:hypothetical protein
MRAAVQFHHRLCRAQEHRVSLDLADQLRRTLYDCIEREIGFARAGKPARSGPSSTR